MSVTKSPYDEKEYRVITLVNGLKTLLISENKLAHPKCKVDDEDESEDEETDDEMETHSSARRKTGSHSCSSEDEASTNENNDENKSRGRIISCAACALCVHVGSFHDPPEVPGLAHLLEHMLFMGSQKYPGENEFDSFVSCHGGMSDASTDYETTIYHFGINKKFFQEALDKFAHFFISPLLTESSLEREIEAVDSEFQNAYQNDTDRLQQLFCSLAIEGHPLRNFPWGNCKTLKEVPCEKGINVSTYLREFYHSYYSASYMTLVVISEDTLDTLEQWVKESFSCLPTNGKAHPSIKDHQPVFDDAVFHRIYKVVPVKDIHLLSVMWLLPSTLNLYRIKPTHYIGWLVGHEGYGSILSYLKKRNLATTLEAGTGREDYEFNTCFTLFSCIITLTEKGVDNVFEVLSVLFQYLKMLQEVGPQERIYKELQSIEQNEFKFKEEMDSVDLVEHLCVAMQFYPPEDYLTGDDLYFEYNSEVISAIQDLLTPDKCMICITSQRFSGAQCNKREQWFNSCYTDEVINPKWTEAWNNLPVNPELYLPPPSTFIASEFSLVSSDTPQTEYPICIEETLHYKLWYKKDDIFKLPRASICVLFKTPCDVLTVENTVLMEIFVRLFNLNIMETGYQATVAQLEYSLTIAYCGLSLCMGGFSHKLPVLFETLIMHLAKFDIDNESQFEMTKEQLRKAYKNLSLKPKKLCRFLRLQVLEKDHFPLSLRITALDKMTIHDYQCFVKKLRNQLFVESLIQGNMTAADAKSLMNYLCKCWKFEPLPKDLQYKPKCLRLPSNTEVNLLTLNQDPSSPNTAITDYYQCSVADPREDVLAQLLVDCMDEPYFDSLRTKKQLGYAVYVGHHNTHDVAGLSLNLITQGQKFSVEYASQCMSEFVNEFLILLESWTNEEFNSHVNALIDAKEEDDATLDEEVDRNWAEIITQSYQFDRLEKQVLALEKISKTKACHWFSRYTQPGENYRKLSVKVTSQVSLQVENVSISSETTSNQPEYLSSPIGEKIVNSCNQSSAIILQSMENLPPATNDTRPNFSNVSAKMNSALPKSTQDSENVKCTPQFVTLCVENIAEFKSQLKVYPRGPTVAVGVGRKPWRPLYLEYI